MLGGLVQSVGLFGRVVIKHVLSKKMLRNPLEILCHANALMVFWAGLYKEMDQEKLKELI